MLSNEDKVRELKKLSAQEVISGADSNGIKYLQYLFDVYPIYFDELCQGCSKKIPGYLKKVKSLNLKDMETVDSQKQEKKKNEFRFKGDKVVHVRGTSKYYSNANLTDEAAIAILKENPNRIALFKKYPANWKELIEAGQDDVTEDKDLSLAELREKYPTISARSKEGFLAKVGEHLAQLEQADNEDATKDKNKNTNEEEE